MLLAGTGSAWAHECFNVKRSATGNIGATGSQGWSTFAEDAREILGPICDAGVAVLAEAGGVTPDTPILSHATMASRTTRNGPGGTPAIQYLDLFSSTGIIQAIPSAFAACAP